MPSADRQLLDEVVSIARRAGDAILSVYGQQFEVTNKADQSPLTLADTRSHDLIVHALGRHTYTLDGDNVRHGLNKDLGFTDADRVENIRRVAEVSKLMVDAGLIVLVSFISPFRSERRLARELMQPGEFYEVFVDTPIEEAERRDPKGLYRKARRGELKNFTGIDSPYEPPEHPEIHLQTVLVSPEEAAEQILTTLRDKGMLQAPDEGTSFDY